MMGGILGLLPGASTAHALQGSCPPPLPLPSLKLRQNEGTLQGLGTDIKEAKTADSDKKANRTECACPAPVPDCTRVCGMEEEPGGSGSQGACAARKVNYLPLEGP